MIDVCMTVEGGPNSLSRLALPESAALAGMRSSSFGGSPPPGQTIEFVDWPFTTDNPNAVRHRRVIDRTEPTLAVAPDIDGKFYTLETVIDLADRYLESAETVIIVPKGIDPRDVPDRFRIGMPFQQSKSDEAFDIDELIQPKQQRFGEMSRVEKYAAAGPVHVLGGNPADQLRIRDESPIEVASVDTALPQQYAQFGRVWFKWGQMQVDPTPVPETLAWSLDNMVDAWNPRRSPHGDLLQLVNRKPRQAAKAYGAALAGRPGTIFDQYLADQTINPDRVQRALRRIEDVVASQADDD